MVDGTRPLDLLQREVPAMFAKTTRNAALTAVVFLAASSPLLADDSPKTLYRKVLNSTALVEVGRSHGTGWVVDRANRLLVTNHHVVGTSNFVIVQFPIYKNGRPVVERSAYKEEFGHRAKVLDVDVARDLAVIQVIDRLPDEIAELKLAPDSAEPADHVHSIGNPGASGGMWIYTSGTVRQIYNKEWANMNAERRLVDQRKAKVCETQSPLNPGDSGGPVVNDKCEVVGVVSGGTMQHRGGPVQLISFTIDVTEVKHFVDQTRRLMTPKTAADFVDRSERLLSRGRYNEAIEDASAALKLDRNCGPAYQKRAMAFSYKNDLDTAVADATTAIKFNDEDKIAFLTRGRAYEMKKDYEKSIADYTRAIQIDPKYTIAFNNRGVVYYQKNDYVKAREDFSRAVELNPKYVLALTNRAECNYQLKQYDKAIADADLATDLNPYTAQGWKLLGWSLREVGELEKAANMFTLALKSDPKNADFWYHRGFVFHKAKNQLGKAVADYNEAIKLAPNWSWPYYQRGLAFENAGKTLEAQDDYEKAMKLNPKAHAETLKKQTGSNIRVINETNEAVRVWMTYEYLDKSGKWVWHPAVQNEFWTVKAGDAIRLVDSNWTVKARRIRIWGTGVTSGGTFTNHKDRELTVAPLDGYLATGVMTFNYTFQK